jgi:protein-tyrosine phosphatase
MYNSSRVARRYGRKAGAARHCLHLVRYWAGGFDSYLKVDWGRVTRLVFVCKGNICRSAYAECRARRIGIAARSFGLDVSQTSSADRHAIDVARTRGLNLADHRTSPIESICLTSNDLIVAMEPYQARCLKTAAHSLGAQVTLLGLWCRPPRPHLEDPFGLSTEYFHTCFDLIDEAVDRFSGLVPRRASDHPL